MLVEVFILMLLSVFVQSEAPSPACRNVVYHAQNIYQVDGHGLI